METIITIIDRIYRIIRWTDSNRTISFILITLGTCVEYAEGYEYVVLISNWE